MAPTHPVSCSISTAAASIVSHRTMVMGHRTRERFQSATFDAPDGKHRGCYRCNHGARRRHLAATYFFQSSSDQEPSIEELQCGFQEEPERAQPCISRPATNSDICKGLLRAASGLAA
jgi:hypothetical protein